MSNSVSNWPVRRSKSALSLRASSPAFSAPRSKNGVRLYEPWASNPIEPATTREENTMSEPVWNRFLTERDKEVFAAAGYGTRQGYGKRPALLVVDVNYNFCGDRPEPIQESIKRWRNSCGA